MTSENHNPAGTGRLRIDEPPPHLSSTNHPPTESEAAEIRRIVHRGRVYISHLQTEINRLKDAMHAIHLECLDVQGKVDQHAAILSPLRRFPPEILGTIFQWTLPPTNSRPAFLTQSPWNISCVCGVWRAISFASPNLWSHISIHATRNFPVNALIAQLERSKPLPLTIYFSCEGVNSNLGALGVLLDNSSRWESVSLLRPPRNTLLRFNALNELQGCLPQLRTLAFKRSDESETCTAFETAPQLVDVRIDGSHRRLLVPYAQLTRLRVQMPRTPDRLCLAQNLIQLTLGKASISLPPPSYPNPIHLPRLRVLFIADGHYLESFLLPALEDICIKENVSFLPAFIDRSACQLRKLTIIEGMIDIVPILDHAPTLLEIRLRRLFAISILVPQLAIPDDGGPVVCPELRHLTLCDVEEEEFLLALEMVDARRKSEEFPSVSLCILDLQLNLNAVDMETEAASGCPYNFPDAYSDLRTEVEWVSRKRATERYEGWKTYYPGGGR
ncbi:hypothetical protein MVEN_01468700 [Mycena venus]|uniref:F-box domain-containing protein n=1 Tax=Mycena venus TaxID=2733690 RepID=A0A8H7CTS0_9AGAR|nr:hypothetical protein MVEN_01468700 [Mycena venus]